MPTNEPMTIAEIQRCLARIEKSIEGMSSKLDNRPTYADLRRVEENLCQDISEIRSWITWCQRIVIGAVILAVLGVAIGTGTT